MGQLEEALECASLPIDAAVRIRAGAEVVRLNPFDGMTRQLAARWRRAQLTDFQEENGGRDRD
jgi:hypothetical protein